MISEFMGVNDVTTMTLWAKLFVEEQGYKTDENILYVILLEKNGRENVGKRSHALDVQYFFLIK